MARISFQFKADSYAVDATSASGFANAVTAGITTFSRASQKYFEPAAPATMLSFTSGTLARDSTKGALIEPAATNVSQQSKVIGSWTITNITQTANLSTAPDGTASEADAINETATNAQHSVASPSFTPTNGNSYIASIYARPRAGTPFIQVALAAAGFGSAVFQNYDPTGKAAGSGGGSNLGGGSYTVTNSFDRVWVAGTATAAAAGGAMFVYAIQSNTDGRAPSFAGATGDGTYIWGGQLEGYDARGPSSLITTTSANVTRAADALGIVLPSGTFDFLVTFDDGSTQTLTGVTGGTTWTVPTNLNRYYIDKIESIDPGILPPLLTNTSTLFAPQLNEQLGMPLLSNANTLFGATINRQLNPGLITNTPTLFAPQLTAQLGMPLLSNANTLFAPQLNEQLTVPLLTNSSTLFAPNLTATLMPPLLVNTSTLFPPALQFPIVQSGGTGLQLPADFGAVERQGQRKHRDLRRSLERAYRKAAEDKPEIREAVREVEEAPTQAVAEAASGRIAAAVQDVLEMELGRRRAASARAMAEQLRVALIEEAAQRILEEKQAREHEALALLLLSI